MDLTQYFMNFYIHIDLTEVREIKMSNFEPLIVVLFQKMCRLCLLTAKAFAGFSIFEHN